ncbi:MAG: hypothetical protein OWR52_09730 [Acidibacillus sp.]|nr:hypothetical protein [Acidibacillus sp.]
MSNTYAFQKVTLGPWGLVVLLAAKADVTLPLDHMARLALAKDANAIVTVDDVSGLSWSASIPVS